jgi:hypothetical protein
MPSPGLLEDAMNDLDREWKTARRPSESPRKRAGGAPLAVVSVLAIAAAGCTETYDAGSNSPHGLLPVDERNPIVLVNDSESENWQGEYAVLLANGGGPKLVGIIVGTNSNSPILEDNVAAWRNLVKAAHDGGLRNIPDPIGSNSDPLTRPASGVIDETVANRSEGAIAIRDAANDFSLPYRPLVVLTGGRLTDVADAYLIEPSLPDRVVVVSALGSLTSTGGAMGVPNGEMDPWADTIVTARFRYVQVSAFYDQLTDVPAARLSDSELPANEFTKWIAAKQPNIWDDPLAADQVAVAAVGIPSFALEVEQVSPAGPVGDGANTGPALKDNPGAPGWLVRQSDGAAATTHFWQLLLDPATFAPAP